MSARRSFLARIGVAAAALTIGAPASAQLQNGSEERSGPWLPARDPKDDWFDRIPGKHRLFFDALTDQGLREARGFANNYFDGNKSGYGLDASDLAVVICLRHSATAFAFGNPFWAKHGANLAETLKLSDPKIAVNPHQAQLEALAKRGVHFAVCDMASHRYAGLVARKIDGDADAIYKEMVTNVLGNAHFVAAGIIAVNRAQERGYSIAYTG